MTKRIKRAAGRLAAAAVAAGALALASPAMASPTGAGTSYIPQRVGVRGTVPNPGTQQQELANITFPAPYNVFEFTITCAGCHGGTIDQQVAHFGVQSGTAMASSARDPVFRANQIAVNNILRTLTGEDGAGNMCFRCHSPNGWYSGRFDPTLGGDAEGRTMMHSIVLSTDDEGISCEQCHRAAGAVAFQKPGLPATTKAFNLLAGIGGYPADPGWPHDGGAFLDQAGDPTVHPGAPFGDTSLQYSEGMSYNGPYSGSVSSSHSDVPVAAWGATDYTGQIFAVYPPGDPRVGQPVVNVDGSIAPTYEMPVGAPIDFANSNFTVNPPVIAYDYQAQSLSIEHPTYGNGFLTKSEFCGSCHDLTVPVLNHGMPEQRTYTEWKFSAYSKPGASTALGVPVVAGRSLAGEVRCQDCHMPQMKHEYADDAMAGPQGDPVITGWFPYAKDRNLDGGGSSHKHAGANRDLAAMMKVLYPEPDLEVIGMPTGADVRIFPGTLSTRNPAYDRNIRNNEISMADAVKLEIASAPAETATPGIYEVQVKVTNRTGHRIPTGYPDGRRMWIGLDVKDAAGASVYASGFYDQAASRLFNSSADQTFTRAQSNVISAGVQQLGNAVLARSIATDGATNVLVVSPAALPAGTLTSFRTWVQAGAEGSVFRAYVLRPGATAGSYTVVHDSGDLTVPATPGAVAAFPASVAVRAGDRIAHYGRGVPFDMSATGADPVYYPATAAPVAGADIVLGGTVYPAFDPAAYGQQPRTYSFGATVDAGNAVMVYERVTCRDGLVPAAPLFDGQKDGICEDSGSPFLPNNTIMFDNRIPPTGFTYADYRVGGIKFWNYALAANPNAGNALRPQPFEDATRYPDGQGFDVVTYRFAAAPGQILSARAQVYWQTHTREFMELLRDQQESLGLADAVRPEGPINAMQVGYPLTPSYLSDVIGLAAIVDPFPSALSGPTLRDNWGGVAYAAWLQTGRGAPAVVAAADSTVTAPPATPPNLAAVATVGLPFEATISWSAVAGADGYLVSILYGCPTRAQLVDAATGLPQVDAAGKPVLEATRCFDPVLDAGKNAISTVGTSTTWDRLAIVPASACDAAGVCSLVNTAMNVNKSYGFKVAAINAAGLSADSSVLTYKSPWDIPSAPQLLKALTITTNSATLTWDDIADNETIFVVQMVPVLPLPTTPLAATLIPTAGGTSVTAPPAPEQVFVFTTQTPGLMGFGGNQQTFTGLSPNTAYNFQVQACNATACSGMNLNGPIQVLTRALLAAPVLAAPAASNAPDVTLTWSATATATSYVVERSADGGATFTALPAVAGTSLVDAGLAYNASYSYRVTASDGVNTSAISNTQTVTTPPAAPVLAVPVVTQPLTVNLSWGTSAGATSYLVERSTDGGATWSALPAVATNALADNAVANSTTYVYRVTAQSAAGPSLPSGTQSVTTPAVALPSAPVVTATLSAAPPPVVSLSWTASAPGVTAYQVQRTAARTNRTAACPAPGASYTNLGTASAALAATDATATTGNRAYCYLVRAINAAGSTASVPVKVVTPPAPAAPRVAASFSRANDPRPANVRLTWQFSTNPVRPTSFIVERATNSGFTANLVSIPVATPAAGTSASYTDATVVAGTRYWYRLRAVNGPMLSAAGASVNGTPR